MSHDYLPSTKPTWSLVAHETMAVMAAAMLYPFGLWRPRLRPTPRHLPASLPRR